MDADLYNLQIEELEAGITYVLAHPEVDMLVFRRKYDPFISKIIRGDLLVSGERIIKTTELKKIFHSTFSNYQIETAINYWMQDQKKNVCWTWHSGKNVTKARKVGVIKGILGEFTFLVSALAYRGPMRYVYNLFFFCPKRVT